MRIVIVTALALSLAGCSLPVLFRVPIVQGNVVSDKDLQKLELGMTQPQVRYLLGTPLVNNGFEPQRWDYVYFYRDPRGKERESRLSLFFENGKLARVEGRDNYDPILPENQDDLDPEDIESPETRPLVPTAEG